MKPSFILSFLALTFFAGCATARLTTGPDVYSLAEYPAAARVGIAKVIDGRGTTSAGMIGGCGIKIKDEELATLATNYLVDGVNRQMRVNVIRVKEDSADSMSAIGKKYGVNYAMLATITELKMHSMDALMQPVEVECKLKLAVYDANGKQVLDKAFGGTYQERIGITVVDKATGRLAERAVKDAMANLVKEPELKEILKTK